MWWYKLGIKSFVNMSLTDWDGKVSSVLFFGGCNFRCPYCHNWQIAFDPGSIADIALDPVFEYLESNKEWIDGVVVTGGEPTIDSGLLPVLRDIKSHSLQVKLDTNGSRPDILEKVIDKGLVDFISMDVKNSYEKYPDTIGTSYEIEDIQESIGIVKGFDSYEFRTTVVPGLVGPDDLVKICGYISGCRQYVLQRFHPENIINKEFAELIPQTDEEMDDLAALCAPRVPVKWRG